MSPRDGIYRGWIVVTGCFLGAFVVFGVSYSFGVFLEPIQRDLGLSRSGVSLVFSIQTLMIYVAAAALGVVADRYGVRRLLIGGTICFAAGAALTTRATSLAAVLVLYGVLSAVGMGAIYVVAYATVPRWFGRRRGLAAGVATAGLGAGMLAVAPVAAVAVERVGWRSALFGLTAGGTVVLLVAAVLIDDDPRTSGVDASTEFPAGPPTANTPSWAAYRADLTAVATSRAFLFVFLGWVFVYTSMYVVFVHVVAHAGDVGLGEHVGALALAAIGATTSVARVGVGALSDRVGRHRTFVACSVLMGATTLAIPFAGSAAALLAVAVAFGVGYGGNGALLSPLTADLFGAANPNAVFGLVSLSFAVSGLLAPWAAGASYDALGSYSPAFLAAGMLTIIGAGLVAVVDDAAPEVG